MKTRFVFLMSLALIGSTVAHAAKPIASKPALPAGGFDKLTAGVVEINGFRWKLALDRSDKDGRVQQYVLEKQSLETSTALVTLETFYGVPQDPQSLWKGLEQTKAALLRHCPSLKFKETARSAKDIAYEWETGGCAGIEAQSEVGYVVQGADGLHVMHYMVKRTGLSEAEKQPWRAWLKSANKV